MSVDDARRDGRDDEEPDRGAAIGLEGLRNWQDWFGGHSVMSGGGGGRQMHRRVLGVSRRGCWRAGNRNRERPPVFGAGLVGDGRVGGFV